MLLPHYMTLFKSADAVLIGCVHSQFLIHFCICSVMASFVKPNLVPRVFSLSNTAAAEEKVLAHSELKQPLIDAFHGAFICALLLVYSFQNKDGGFFRGFVETVLSSVFET